MSKPLTKEEARAADILEALYISATRARLESEPRVWDPDARPVTRRLVFADAYSPWLGGLTPWDYDAAYERSTAVLMPVIAEAARGWTVRMLEEQAMQVGRVTFAVDTAPERLHAAARAAVDSLPRIMGRELTREEYIEVTGQGRRRSAGTVVKRLERVSYMRAVREQGDWYLHKLMVHPRGVALVKAFAHSAEEGREDALEVLAEAEKAIRELSSDIRDDEDLVWRYPVGVAAGVASAGLAARPALTGFALAWARWGEPDTIGDVLDAAGNAILALQLVGGPLGALVGEVLDFVLGVASTAVSLVRAAEQDQAATATAFSDEAARLSEGGSYGSAALVGATTILAAIALPAVVSAVTRPAVKGAARLEFGPAPATGRSPVDDRRAIERRGIEVDPVTPGERGLGDAGRGIAAPATQRLDDARVVEKAPSDRGIADGTSAQTGRNARQQSSSGTSANATGGNRQLQNQSTANRQMGKAVTPPPRRGTPGQAATNNPLTTDTRTANGGIRTVDQHVSPNNETVVMIEGRIDPVTLPDSLYRAEWQRARPDRADLDGYDSCHLFPLQWGDEAAAGFMYAHGPKFNRSLQKRLENIVRDLLDDLPAGAELRVRVTGRSHPRHLQGSAWGNVLKQLRYEFQVVSPRGAHAGRRVEFDVSDPPHGDIVEVATPFATVE